MAFDSTIIHWRTLAEFADALAKIPRPAWVKGITHHNTYIPDDLNWGGMASMLSMREYYIKTKQWTSGPNLYLCAKAPNPADLGIWQMTPITHPGTHGGACNSDHLGIENVADWESRRPTKEQYTLLLLVSRLIMQQWGLPPSAVNVHNECMTGRTCPGKYVTGTQIRADLALPVPRPIPKPSIPYILISPCTPLTARSPSAPLASGVVFAAGDRVNVGPEGTQDGWLWVSDKPDTAPGIGWIPSSYARPL